MNICGNVDNVDSDFSDSTTCHGPKRFCNSNWHPFRRVLWLLLVLISLGLLTQQLYERFSQFLRFEMKTDVRTETKKSLPMPTVTLCNVNMFSSAHLNDMDLELLELSKDFYNSIDFNSPKNYRRNLSLDDWASADDVLPKLKELVWGKAEEFQKEENRILQSYGQLGNFTVPKWLERTSWRLNYSSKNGNYTAIMSCIFGKAECEARRFKPVLTKLGLCHSFNPKANFNQRNGGVEAGLKIIVDVGEQDYSDWTLDHEWTFGAGLFVYVHEWHELPALGTIVVTPSGFASYVGIRRQEVRTVNAPPWGVCRKNVVENNGEIMPFSHGECLTQCSFDATVRQCGCRLWYEPGSFPLCGVINTTACLTYKAYGNFYNVLENELYLPNFFTVFCFSWRQRWC